MDDINLGLYPWPQLCPLGLTTNYGLLWCPCLHCGASLDSISQAVATSHTTPCPHLPPTHPLSYADPKLVQTFKNDLKWPKIIYYNKFNRSISPVQQTKVGLTRAKAGNAN